MEKGHDVDIVTGKPVEKGELDPKEQAKLQAAARYVGISETAAGMLLIQEIEAALIRRIGSLIDTDPEAKAYRDMLLKLGYREHAGKVAVDQLTRKFGLKSR